MSIYAQWLPVLAFALALPYAILSGPYISSAHDSLNRFVRHDVSMRIDQENVDVSIELTFYAEHAATLRAALDTNGDGSISQREVKQYFTTLQTPYLSNVSLYVENQPLELIELFPPEVDLVEVVSPGSDPCSIRISCFARTPAGIEVGDHFTLRDGSWPEFPALHTVEVVGEDGFELNHIREAVIDLNADDVSETLRNLPAENFVLLCASAPPPVSPNAKVVSQFNLWEIFVFLGAITATGTGFRFVVLKISREKENSNVP